MKLIGRAVIFFSLAAIAQAQGIAVQTANTMKVRDSFVANHLQTLKLLDNTFVIFYKLVNSTTVSTFVNLKQAAVGLNNQFKAVGTLSPKSNFTKLQNSMQFVSSIDMITSLGIGQVTYSAYGAFSGPAKYVHDVYTTIMEALSSLMMMPAYYTINTPRLSDVCIEKIFKAAQLLYEVPVNQSFKDAQTATNIVKALPSGIETDLNNAKAQLDSLSLKIKNCNKVETCLEGLYQQYGQGTGLNDFSNAVTKPLYQFSQKITPAISIYPTPATGWTQFNATKIYDLEKLC